MWPCLILHGWHKYTIYPHVDLLDIKFFNLQQQNIGIYNFLHLINQHQKAFACTHLIELFTRYIKKGTYFKSIYGNFEN